LLHLLARALDGINKICWVVGEKGPGRLLAGHSEKAQSQPLPEGKVARRNPDRHGCPPG